MNVLEDGQDVIVYHFMNKITVTMELLKIMVHVFNDVVPILIVHMVRKIIMEIIVEIIVEIMMKIIMMKIIMMKIIMMRIIMMRIIMMRIIMMIILQLTVHLEFRILIGNMLKLCHTMFQDNTVQVFICLLLLY